MFSSLILAQDTPSATLQWITLLAAIVMPIIVVSIAAVGSRRQSLYDLRSQQLVRVYEELFERITVYGIAAIRHENVFEHYLSVQAKIDIARIHSSIEIFQELEGFEKMAAGVLEASLMYADGAPGADIGEQVSLEVDLRERVGKMMALLEVLASAVNEQLGPQYTASRSWWQRWQSNFLYAVFKAREKLMRKKMSKEKKQDNAA